MTLNELLTYIRSDECRLMLMKYFDYVDQVFTEIPGRGSWMFHLAKAYTRVWNNSDKYRDDMSRVIAHLRRLSEDSTCRPDADGYEITFAGGIERRLTVTGIDKGEDARLTLIDRLGADGRRV